jgi:hypothetical protein
MAASRGGPGPAPQDKAALSNVTRNKCVSLSLSLSVPFLVPRFLSLVLLFPRLGQTFDGLRQSIFRGDSISTIVSITIVALCFFSCAFQQAHYSFVSFP